MPRPSPAKRQQRGRALQEKRCRLCGKVGHTLVTCSLPGASEFRALRGQKLHKSKTKLLRKPQKLAKAVKKNVKKNQYAAKQRKLYSGSLAKDTRSDRVQPVCHTAEEALEKLVSAGFVMPPPKCQTCGQGTLTVARRCGARPTVLHYRCSERDCDSKQNVLKHFQPLKQGLHRSWTAPSLLTALQHYTAAQSRCGSIPC